MKKVLLTLVISISSLSILVGCNSNSTTSSIEEPEKKEHFTLWNKDAAALKKLINFVEKATDEKSDNFIPVEDRIATFDMDGTFIGELYPTYFEYNMLEYRVLQDESYKDIAPADVVETANDIRNFVTLGTPLPRYNQEFGFDIKHAYAAAKAYSGMTLAEFDKYVKDYAKNRANGFENMTYAESFYKPMLEVFDYLEENNFTYYVVSGSDRFICRALVDSLNIPSNRVIGMDVELKSNNQGDTAGVNYTGKPDEYLVRTDNLLIKNLKENKVKLIAQEIGKAPVLSFGNSSGDSAMHNYCLGNPKYNTEAFMLVADDDVRDHADLTEAAKRQSTWEESGYNVISMKNDFKTIYGENVKKVNFFF